MAQESVYEVADRKLDELYYAARNRDDETFDRVEQELDEIYDIDDFHWPEII